MITIGLIGCGIWGRAILRDLLSLGVSVKVFDSGQSAEGRRQKAGGRRQKAEVGRQEAEGRRQKAEGRRQEAEGRRQKAEGRRQEAEVGRQKSEDVTPHSSLLTPDSSLLTPHSSLLTPDSSLPTPDSSLLTPHSSLLTPDSSLPTPHSSLPTPHSSLLSPLSSFVPHLSDLADTDGLIVATPSSTHRAVLEKVLPWQLPTFVEKPLTTSLEDALYLASLPHSTYIYMMHVWRYHGGIQLLGELARSGRLGNITALRSIRSNWTSPRTDTDSVWNLAPHDLTIALEILGYLPPPKAATIEWHQGVARGMTALLGDSPFVQIEVSNRSPDKRREVRLFGTEGMAVLADEKTDHLDVYYGDDRSYPAPVRHEKMYFDATPPLRQELAAFVGFLQGGPAPISNFQEGLLTIEVLAQLEKLAISPQ